METFPFVMETFHHAIQLSRSFTGCAPKPCHLDVVDYIAEGIEADPVIAARRVLAGEILAVLKARSGVDPRRP